MNGDGGDAPRAQSFGKSEGKPQFHHLSPVALAEAAKVMGFGAEKYDDYDWLKGMPYSECYDSLMRHVTDWFWHRLDKDPESGLHPLGHAMCKVMFLLDYDLNKRGTDDRPTPG